MTPNPQPARSPATNKSVQTVLFDVGGTLLRVQPSVGQVYADAARQHGCETAPAKLNASFGAAWRRSLERRRERNFHCSDEYLREEWYRVVCDTFGEVVPKETMPRLFDDLYDAFATAEAWEVAPGVHETLEYLSRRGVRLGVLSNWDSRLHTTLRDSALHEAFDFVVVSYQVGVEKPHPEIFRVAVEQGGRHASETLLVGDSWEADIQAARQLGIATLWVASDEDRSARSDAGPGMASFPVDPANFWDPWLDGSHAHLHGADP